MPQQVAVSSWSWQIKKNPNNPKTWMGDHKESYRWKLGNKPSSILLTRNLCSCVHVFNSSQAHFSILPEPRIIPHVGMYAGFDLKKSRWQLQRCGQNSGFYVHHILTFLTTLYRHLLNLFKKYMSMMLYVDISMIERLSKCSWINSILVKCFPYCEVSGDAAPNQKHICPEGWMLPKYKIHGWGPKVLFILLRSLQFIVSLPSPVPPDLFGLPFPAFSTISFQLEGIRLGTAATV